eukprot:11702351-Alexandrium_andersonii.AAC.2
MLRLVCRALVGVLSMCVSVAVWGLQADIGPCLEGGVGWLGIRLLTTQLCMGALHTAGNGGRINILDASACRMTSSCHTGRCSLLVA